MVAACGGTAMSATLSQLNEESRIGSVRMHSKADFVMHFLCIFKRKKFGFAFRLSEIGIRERPNMPILFP